ncbi:uncharacterized protein EAF01_004757 [Botrytis porri]|uniref:uncharacterized protein n=1 Tax=Botrytis porri TaxID=87229 RepID=UPI0018FFF856|nr:uncharacterized protein EAF01_004757 [Botrytis porri]KAF7907170.1 hypothetical protein EAF01_004757 [Botrytis porri]
MSTRSSPSPNTKSDTQWLHDLGYPTGLHSFKLDYGFSPDDAQDHLDALILFHQFRAEQQEMWEKRHPSCSHLHSAKTETKANAKSTAKSKSELVIRETHTGDTGTRTSISVFAFGESTSEEDKREKDMDRWE